MICGVSGQDGSLLARFLVRKGYQVFGTSRDAQVSPFANLHRLQIADKVETHSMSLVDFRSVYQILDRVQPDEVYNLAGQTSVGLSFEQPMEAFESITVGTLNLLEVIRFGKREVRLYNAGSSECFGDTGDCPATEQTPFRPRSPYGIAKAASVWSVANYREAYGLKACSGILFNHESPLRPERFVTKKIVSTAVRIANGSNETLTLGNLDVRRDWGWAPEYVEAMWKMVRLKEPEDLVIASGETHSLREFVDRTFAELGLDWQDHVRQDERLFRRTDIRNSAGNSARARRVLNWTSRCDFRRLVRRLILTERLMD